MEYSRAKTGHYRDFGSIGLPLGIPQSKMYAQALPDVELFMPALQAMRWH
jgi:hypothetical protein